ncbi:MAG: GTPase ObgE [Chloroflexota bacterium]
MLDKVEIVVQGGNGGDGAINFRREKHVPFGGPDGGDGGDGGSVILRAYAQESDLRSFREGKVYRAVQGGNGMGKKKHGKNGEALVLPVPMGTMVKELTEAGGVELADLAEDGQEVVVARGGKGGWGNTHFVSSTNQAPRLAQKGESGERKRLFLELRLIAEVGVIGYPNVGKSTLLTALSAARPRIASYPFTTTEPVLGVVEVGERQFVLAEIPGLIEGAHLGRGLGHDFLRHAVRTRVLVHLIDGSSPSPVEDWAKVNQELALFDPGLAQKKQVVAINKIDLPEVRARMAELREAFAGVAAPVYFISAQTGEGTRELAGAVVKILGELPRRAEEAPPRVFRPQPRRRLAEVRQEGEVFILEAPEIERILARSNLSDLVVRGQINRMMSRALERAGIKPGDKVRCGAFEWEW